MRSTLGLRGASPGGLRALERALWIAGALGLGWCALVIAVSRIDEAIASRRLDAAIAARRSAGPAFRAGPEPTRDPIGPARPETFGPPAPSARASERVPRARTVPAAPERGGIIARIEIASIGLSAVAREGEDARTLRFAVGHLPGTPVPPAPGNAVFAGHRDRHFRGLGRLKPDDPIRLTTESGEFLYRVEWTAVVEPDALWVLDPTPEPSLTLVTCFPFGYLGNAPDRFVVRAHRVEN